MTERTKNVLFTLLAFGVTFIVAYVYWLLKLLDFFLALPAAAVTVYALVLAGRELKKGWPA